MLLRWSLIWNVQWIRTRLKFDHTTLPNALRQPNTNAPKREGMIWFFSNRKPNRSRKKTPIQTVWSGPVWMIFIVESFFSHSYGHSISTTLLVTPVPRYISSIKHVCAFQVLAIYEVELVVWYYNCRCLFVFWCIFLLVILSVFFEDV